MRTIEDQWNVREYDGRIKSRDVGSDWYRTDRKGGDKIR